MNGSPRPILPSQKAWLEIASDNHSWIFTTLLPKNFCCLIFCILCMPTTFIQALIFMKSIYLDDGRMRRERTLVSHICESIMHLLVEKNVWFAMLALECYGLLSHSVSKRETDRETEPWCYIFVNILCIYWLNKGVVYNAGFRIIQPWCFRERERDRETESRCYIIVNLLCIYLLNKGVVYNAGFRNLHYSALVIQTGRQNPDCTYLWIYYLSIGWIKGVVCNAGFRMLWIIKP